MYPESGTDQWFALRVKSRHERVVSRALLHKGYDSFLPTYRWKNGRLGRRKEVELPLFPGYVFCRFQVLRRLPILMTPGIVHVVGIARAPVPVDDVEITSLQKAMQEKLAAEPSDFLQVGQRVRIVEGALSGVEGILLDFKNSLQLVLSITLLYRSVRVQIDRDCVETCVPVVHAASHRANGAVLPLWTNSEPSSYEYIQRSHNENTA